MVVITLHNAITKRGPGIPATSKTELVVTIVYKFHHFTMIVTKSPVIDVATVKAIRHTSENEDYLQSIYFLYLRCGWRAPVGERHGFKPYLRLQLRSLQ